MLNEEPWVLTLPLWKQKIVAVLLALAIVIPFGGGYGLLIWSTSDFPGTVVAALTAVICSVPILVLTGYVLWYPGTKDDVE